MAQKKLRLATMGAIIAGGVVVSLAMAANAEAQTFDQAAFDLLPASIKQTKVIHNSVDAPVVPWITVDASGKMAGPVVDLTDAIGKTLGVTFVTNASTQANTVLEIQSKRVDLSFGTMGDTPDLEKVGSFLVDLLNPRAFLVKKGNPKQFIDLSSICGMSIGLQGTSSSLVIIQAASKQYCTDQNKPPMTVKSFPSLAGIALAVQSGQVDSMLLTLPQVLDIAKSAPSQFEVVLDKTPNGMPPIAGGIFFGKDSELVPAFQKAFADIISSGVYMAILKKYGLEGSAMSQVVLNMAATQPAMMQASPALTYLK